MADVGVRMRPCVECGEGFLVMAGGPRKYTCARCEQSQIDDVLLTVSARLNAKPAAEGEEGERGVQATDGQ